MAKGIDSAGLLRAARERSGLSQRALAERAGTSQSVVARIELGQTSPTVPTLNRLLDAAGATMDVPVVAGPDLVARTRAFFAAAPATGIVSAYVFGSTARRARHRESDVDVAVVLDRKTYPQPGDRAGQRVRLAAELVAALGVNDVDLIVLNDVPPGLARAIVLDGVLVADFDAAADRDFVTYVQLRHADLEPFLRRAAVLKRAALSR
jgi:transcriptional regulator with XRE-family HTH domain